jgi:hypothetical protein
MINERRFWALIDESRAAADGHLKKQGPALGRLLQGRSREDLESFAELFDTLRWEAYRWDTWGAGYLLAGGMREEAFERFRTWLISRGRRIYEIGVTDPDRLAEVVSPDTRSFEIEGLWLAAHEVYEDAFGEDMPVFDDVPIRLEPAGEPWSEDDLEERLPRLWRQTEDWS